MRRSMPRRSLQRRPRPSRNRRRRNSTLAAGRNLFGLSPQAKARLLEKVSSASPMRAMARLTAPASGEGTNRLSVAALDGFKEISMIREAADFLGIADPFFRVHEGIAGAETMIGNTTYVNFASYNYIGLNGHPEVTAAAKAA